MNTVTTAPPTTPTETRPPRPGPSFGAPRPAYQPRTTPELMRLNDKDLSLAIGSASCAPNSNAWRPFAHPAIAERTAALLLRLIRNVTDQLDAPRHVDDTAEYQAWRTRASNFRAGLSTRLSKLGSDVKAADALDTLEIVQAELERWKKTTELLAVALIATHGTPTVLDQFPTPFVNTEFTLNNWLELREQRRQESTARREQALAPVTALHAPATDMLVAA